MSLFWQACLFFTFGFKKPLYLFVTQLHSTALIVHRNNFTCALYTLFIKTQEYVSRVPIIFNVKLKN